MFRTGRDTVLKYRQAGFTTLELARDIWFCLVNLFVACAVVTQPHKTNEPTKKVIKQLSFILDHLGVDVGAEWSGGTCTFNNGSTLTVFDAGGSEDAANKQGRGGTYHRVHVTELAYFPYAQEVITALDAAIPTAEQGGEVVEESTANGAYGVFYEHYQGAKACLNGRKAHFFPWYMQEEYKSGNDETPAIPSNPDEAELITTAKSDGVVITNAQLKWWREQRALKGSLDKVLQEYPHNDVRAFTVGGSCYFDLSAVNALEKLSKPPTPPELLTGELAALVVELNNSVNSSRGAQQIVACRVWEPPQSGVEYLVAVDTASGKTGQQHNWLVAEFFRRDTHQHVATLHEQRHPTAFSFRLAKLATLYNLAEIAVERNNHGGTVIATLESESCKYTNLWRDEKGEIGFWTGRHNRTRIIDALVHAVANAQFKTWDYVFVQQCRTFIRHDDGSIAAASGEQDDMVLAGAIGWEILTLPPPPKVKVTYGFKRIPHTR